jgi:hypothetical protein
LSISQLLQEIIMSARQKVRGATLRELTWFQQNDLRRDEVLKMIANIGNRRTLAPMLQPHEKPWVEEFVDRLPKGKGAAKILGGIGRFGMKAALQAGLPPLRLPTSAVTNQYKLDIQNGEHETGDTYKIALYVAASTIGAGTTAYTSTNEVANGGGYTTGGQALSGRAASLDGSTAILDWTTDPQWTSSTITARGAMIYNDTHASNLSLCVLDFGADIISTNGNFNVVFPAAAAATALIRIA